MEQEPPFETVTKLEVAERQLRVAIRLFFERKDMIAVHALAVAAQDILRALAKPKGIKGMYAHIDEWARPDKRKELLNLFRDPQNFFKHADAMDPNEKLNFYYGTTEHHLFDAFALYRALTGRVTVEMEMFFGWFVSKHPDLFKPIDEESSPSERAFSAKIQGVDFDDFEMVLQFLDKLLRQQKSI